MLSTTFVYVLYVYVLFSFCITVYSFLLLAVSKLSLSSSHHGAFRIALRCFSFCLGASDVKIIIALYVGFSLYIYLRETSELRFSSVGAERRRRSRKWQRNARSDLKRRSSANFHALAPPLNSQPRAGIATFRLRLDGGEDPVLDQAAGTGELTGDPAAGLVHDDEPASGDGRLSRLPGGGNYAQTRNAIDQANRWRRRGTSPARHKQLLKSAPREIASSHVALLRCIVTDVE